MPGAGTYVALCPSGLSRHQVELLFPAQHDPHAHHGSHGVPKGSPAPAHEHGDGYCEFTVYSAADSVRPFTMELARLQAALEPVARSISVVVVAEQYYEARGPPAGPWKF
jgi:hypothetical protein